MRCVTVKKEIKKITISARLDRKTVKAIDLFQQKERLEYRTDALEKLIAIGCNAVGIDLSKINSEQKPKEQDGDEVTYWICPDTDRMGDYTRCERRFKAGDCSREKVLNCKKPSDYFKRIILGLADGQDIKELQKEGSHEATPEEVVNEIVTEDTETESIEVNTENTEIQKPIVEIAETEKFQCYIAEGKMVTDEDCKYCEEPEFVKKSCKQKRERDKA